MLLYIHICKSPQMYQPQKIKPYKKKHWWRKRPPLSDWANLYKKKNPNQQVCQNTFRLTANNLEIHTVCSLVQETNLILPRWFKESQENCETLTGNTVFSNNKEKVGKLSQEGEGRAKGRLQRHQRPGQLREISKNYKSYSSSHLQLRLYFFPSVSSHFFFSNSYPIHTSKIDWFKCRSQAHRSEHRKKK